jgi:hypothetical protein
LDEITVQESFLRNRKGDFTRSKILGHFNICEKCSEKYLIKNRLKFNKESFIYYASAFELAKMDKTRKFSYVLSLLSCEEFGEMHFRMAARSELLLSSFKKLIDISVFLKDITCPQKQLLIGTMPVGFHSLRGAESRRRSIRSRRRMKTVGLIYALSGAAEERTEARLRETPKITIKGDLVFQFTSLPEPLSRMEQFWIKYSPDNYVHVVENGTFSIEENNIICRQCFAAELISKPLEIIYDIDIIYL